MPVNLSARITELLINGKDFSKSLYYYKGSDNQVDVSGIVSHNGEIVLIPTIGLDESLDDRTNSRFSRGNTIVINIITDSSNTYRRYPRGALRILQSEYSPITRRLTLQVGDILALNNFREEEDDKSGITFGQNTPRSIIINRLLQAAGCPASSGGPSDPIPYPLPKFEGSYIQQAGQIAFAAGYYLWVNGNEEVRCDFINLAPTTPIKTYILAKDVARYERLNGAEKPCEIVRCLGTTQKIKTIPNPSTNTVESYSTKGNLLPQLFPGSAETILASRIRTTVTWNPGSKVETTVAVHEQPFAATTYTNLVSTSISLVRWKTENTQKFYDTKGRLSRVEFTDSRPPGYFVAAAFTSPSQQPIVGIKSTIGYTYDSKDIISRIERFEYQTSSTLYSGFTSTNFTDTNDISFKLVLSKRITEEWIETIIDTWKYSVTEQINQVSADTLNSSPNLVTVSSNTTISNNGQTTPPATEYHRPDFESESKQLIGIARFNTAASAFKPRRRDYQIEYATSEAQLTALAQKLGGFLYGREKGQQIDLELGDEILSNYKPLARIDVDEGDITQALLLDGCSWVLTQNRALVSSDSPWIGRVTAQGLIPPYKASSAVSGTIVIGGGVKHYPYSLLPSFGRVSGGIRISGKVVDAVIPPSISYVMGGIRIGGVVNNVAPFTPASIPGLLAHYTAVASGVVLTDGRISSWLDQSGNNNHATQGASGNQPTIVNNALNQLSAIRFDGNDFFSLTAGLTNQAFTIFCIVKPANSNPLTLVSAGGGSFQYRIHQFKQELIKAFVAEIGAGNTVLSATTYSQINLTYSSPNLSFRTNQSVDRTMNSPTTFNSPTIDRIGINGASGGEFFAGDLIELLIYTALNLEQIQLVENYLNSKMSS